MSHDIDYEAESWWCDAMPRYHDIDYSRIVFRGCIVGIEYRIRGVDHVYRFWVRRDSRDFRPHIGSATWTWFGSMWTRPLFDNERFE